MGGWSRPAIKCYKCQGSHYLDVCPEFQALSGEEMRDYLLSTGRCGVCCRYHPSQACQMVNVRCWICQGNHVAGVHKAAIVENDAVDAVVAETPEVPEEA